MGVQPPLSHRQRELTAHRLIFLAQNALNRQPAVSMKLISILPDARSDVHACVARLRVGLDKIDSPLANRDSDLRQVVSRRGRLV